MADKNQKQQVRTIYKVLAIFGCVLFVVLMIVSSMGSSWLTVFSAVRPGDAVTIDLTIRDKSGLPLVTSNQQVYQQAVAAGRDLFYTKQLVFKANQSSTEAVVPIPVYSGTAGWTASFALFGGEHDAITQGIVGMKKNEQKTITIPFTGSMTQFWGAAQLKRQEVDLTGIHVGDKLAMAVSDTDALAVNASESSYSIRLGEVTQKTAEGVTIDFGYPSIDLTVLAINSQ
jgi:hypothetical protein